MRKPALTRKQRPAPRHIVVKALRAVQGEGVSVYSFFMPGAEIARIADISRFEGDNNSLKGFQRPEIRTLAGNIVHHLNQGGVLFPNAIMLAMSPEVRFMRSRGPVPVGSAPAVDAGVLNLPLRPEGERVTWIVDGQQRSLALTESNTLVPVVGFISDDIGIQREQFMLVNKSRPLPTRLINELLPETDRVILPRDLAARRIPSELCNLLNRDPKSPFYSLISRASEPGLAGAVVSDTAIITMIRNSINNPLGALAPFKAGGDDAADIQSMYQTLMTYWTAVKDVFEPAWGLPPIQSRLMHSAGIQAMGVLMDRLCARHAGKTNEYQAIREDLQRMSGACHWMDGRWELLGLAWNEIENTHKDIRSLSDALVRIYAARASR